MKQFDWERFYTFTKDRPPWPRLVKAVSLLAHKEYALDLGYGAGQDTRYLLGQGLYVTAVDADRHAIARLVDVPQDRLRAVQSSFEEFRFETYDLINAQFALPFVPKEHFNEVFGRVKRALKPGGIFVGQFFGLHDEGNTAGRPITFLTREHAEELLIGMQLIEFNAKDPDNHVPHSPPTT